MLGFIKDWNHKRLKKRHAIENRIRELQRQIHWLSQAFVDTGLSTLKLRTEVLRCPEQYEYILFSIRPGDLVIDGGANLGLFSDLMLQLGARVYAFEPNPSLTYHLARKYARNENLVLIEKAISTKESLLTFEMPCGGSFVEQSQGGGISVHLNSRTIDYQVKSVDFCDFLDGVLVKTKKEKIKLIKLDIEGAEFDVLNEIIDRGYFNKFDCLLCETHERAFSDGESMLANVKKKILDKNITNIYLDWV